MKVILAGLLALVGFISLGTSTARVINESIVNAEAANESIPLNSQWQVDVIDTLDTLKEVLTTFEKKWEEVPLEVDNGTLPLQEQANNTKATNLTETQEAVTTTRTLIREGTIRNEFSERQPIVEDPSRRVQGDKMYGCPHTWPHHDAYPVMEPTCSSDTECGSGELCCQLFNNNYCFKPQDATPRPGECRFTKFNFLASLHCMVDDPGCKFDSECGEPSWKCCKGPCRYKECLPSTVSLSPSDIQRQQRLQDSVDHNSTPDEIDHGLQSTTSQQAAVEEMVTTQQATEEVATTQQATVEEMVTTQGTVEQELPAMFAAPNPAEPPVGSVPQTSSDKDILPSEEPVTVTADVRTQQHTEPRQAHSQQQNQQRTSPSPTQAQPQTGDSSQAHEQNRQPPQQVRNAPPQQQNRQPPQQQNRQPPQQQNRQPPQQQNRQRPPQENRQPPQQQNGQPPQQQNGQPSQQQNRQPTQQQNRQPPRQQNREPPQQQSRQPAQQQNRQQVNQQNRQAVDQQNRTSVDQQDRQPVDQQNRQPVDQQNRQPMDQQNREPVDQQNRQPVDQQNRQPVEQRNRQPPQQQPARQQSRQPAPQQSQQLENGLENPADLLGIDSDSPLGNTHFDNNWSTQDNTNSQLLQPLPGLDPLQFVTNPMEQSSQSNSNSALGDNSAINFGNGDFVENFNSVEDINNNIDNTAMSSNTDFQNEFLPFFDFRFGEIENVNF